VVNITTNKVVRLLGKTEPNRFLNMSLYQGAPNKKALITMVIILKRLLSLLNFFLNT